MEKVQIIINGTDAMDALEQLKALCAGLGGRAETVTIQQVREPVPAATPKSGNGKKKTEAAPATEGPTPAAASPAQADTSSASPAATGAASATIAAEIDLENGDGDEGGEEPTYQELAAAMSAALDRAGDPLVVQEAFFRATGAKALKFITTTGAAGGPIVPGKGKAALAALEAVGRS